MWKVDKVLYDLSENPKVSHDYFDEFLSFKRDKNDNSKIPRYQINFEVLIFEVWSWKTVNYLLLQRSKI